MRSLPGFHILDQIHESEHSVVLRARRLDDDLPVVIKMLKEDYPPLTELARYRWEYELSKQYAKCAGLVRIIESRELANGPVLVVEDFGAESLKKLRAERAFTLEQVLDLGVRVSGALAELHEAGLIHKDLNPSNILWNPETGQVKLAALGIATPLTREAPEFQNPEVVEGNLTYISPEQTGRGGRSVDFRTDFYALGETLYELLTGRPPFESEDPAELIECHLGKDPVPPSALYPEIPQVVSRIVLKLMAKSPERRFQSAGGIKADLERCLSQLRETGKIEDFEIASRDFSTRLMITEKFFGRERELRQLTEAFEQACQGQSVLFLIAGFSGVGKTSLVRQLFPTLTVKRGFFLSGKFDRFGRSRPYKALLDALQQLVQYLMGESEQRLAAWKARILAALRPNAGVMTEMLPDLALLIGPQPAPVPLSHRESQNRFDLVFQNFLGTFGTPESPLVLFLDDLQWADPASLKLLQRLVGSGEGMSLLLLGA